MKIAVIGGGAFGTALAATWSKSGNDVMIYMRDEELAHAITQTHHNPKYLPQIPLPSTLKAQAHWQGVQHADVVALVLPAQQTRQWLETHHKSLGNALILACAKGIDRENGQFQTALIEQFCPKNPNAVLSGPGFAMDIAKGLPTAMSLGIEAHEVETFQSGLSTDNLRLYASMDKIGVQLGGALKNVIAIGCGVAIGAGLGQSARAALLTRGMNEILRLAAPMGAQSQTLLGLSGLGDLTLTATSELSRNYSLGLAMGSGSPLPQGQTTEGAYTASIALNIAQKHNIDLPIIQTIAELIEQKTTVQEALKSLFARPLKHETE